MVIRNCDNAYFAPNKAFYYLLFYFISNLFHIIYEFIFEFSGKILSVRNWEFLQSGYFDSELTEYHIQINITFIIWSNI